MKHQTKALFILGAADTTRNLFPRGTGAEVWSLAQNRAWLDDDVKVDLWFELHEPDAWKNAKRMVEQLTPIIMAKPYIPGALIYPLEEVLDIIPHRYMTSSFSYMLGLAMLRGFTEVHLFGWNMAADEEYSGQRPGAEYLIGLAEGRGIKVVIPEGSALLKAARLYAFEPASPLEAHLRDRRKALTAQVAELQAKLEAIRAEVNTYDGAKQDVDYLLRVMGVDL